MQEAREGVEAAMKLNSDGLASTQAMLASKRRELSGAQADLAALQEAAGQQGGTEALAAEMEAVDTQVAELHRAMDALRGEIEASGAEQVRGRGGTDLYTAT